jgi:NAD(P)-dependent dehydrogenase (short-subunit alcohol dehydrogenase family)
MEGKVAIVTGGAGGLGSEICRKFAARGAAVAVADMNGEVASEVARSIASDGGRAIAAQVEVTNEDSVTAAVRTAVNELGRTDYLVHCAGTNIKSPVLEMSLDQWNLSLEAHLTGAFLFCREAGRQMVEQGDGGSVVLMSSVAATAPVPERGAYGPAKAALINFAGQLGLEWARYGINVNAVCPGVAITPMTEMVYSREPELRAQRLKRFPIKREVLPEEVADLVLFLCSDEARYINGVGIPIDGGFLNSGFYQDPES